MRACVCLSVGDHIFGTTMSDLNVIIFCVCVLPSDMLRTSGFMDDVIFARKPMLPDVAAQLRRSSHAALGLAINGAYECCLPGVFCDSGDTPANLLCELNGHLMPCTSCFYGKWVKDVEYLSILLCDVLWAVAPGLVAVLPMWDSAYNGMVW